MPRRSIVVSFADGRPQKTGPAGVRTVPRCPATGPMNTTPSPVASRGTLVLLLTALIRLVSLFLALIFQAVIPLLRIGDSVAVR